MTQITIGKSGNHNICLDLDIFLRTRLLITSNSGGGKSFTIRRLAEQLFGKIQVILIVPEGEFNTLREKYGYVLVGKGGETPADPRSAAMLAEKLLELKASAVCDLYEMKSLDRHRWVRLFLDSMIDAPKRLWHPVVVILDEAHVVCPEKGTGESEASEAVIALTTRGRKRGFACCLATQRLSKLRKDAAAELLNILVGPTFMDTDRERAADALGVARSDRQAFFNEIKVLKPGHFYGLGRAIALERTLVAIGPIQTTHPEPGSSKHSAEPPPPPEKVKALLPKLADLPKAAEEQAKTVAELKQEVRSLRGQLRAQPIKTETRETKVIDHAAVGRAVAKRDAVYDRQMRKLVSGLMTIAHTAESLATKTTLVPVEIIPVEMRAEPLEMKRLSSANIERGKQAVRRLAAKAAALNGEESIGKCETSILATLAQHGECDMGRLALLSGYRKSGGFKNSISRLRTLGYLDGANTGIMQITEAGLKVEAFDSLPIGRELFEYWLNSPRMGVCEREIMKMLDGRRNGSTMEEIADNTGYALSGGFKNSLSKLRTAGVIVGRNTERMRLSEELI